ncbi:hypothetical protein HaLaN_17180 [Haematococcus lacustris]|uniref:Uncharacterized protein n=1 Tax=Haematococcus lacustris TaxID=44745 RepID=A0A699ZNP3_HAELA|nr:hypothetical protein HaLaN_17180 [Haematococcus lacustris]
MWGNTSSRRATGRSSSRSFFECQDMMISDIADADRRSSRSRPFQSPATDGTVAPGGVDHVDTDMLLGLHRLNG